MNEHKILMETNHTRQTPNWGLIEGYKLALTWHCISTINNRFFHYALYLPDNVDSYYAG